MEMAGEGGAEKGRKDDILRELPIKAVNYLKTPITC